MELLKWKRERKGEQKSIPEVEGAGKKLAGRVHQQEDVDEELF